VPREELLVRKLMLADGVPMMQAMNKRMDGMDALSPSMHPACTQHAPRCTPMPVSVVLSLDKGVLLDHSIHRHMCIKKAGMEQPAYWMAPAMCTPQGSYKKPRMEHDMRRYESDIKDTDNSPVFKVCWYVL